MSVGDKCPPAVCLAAALEGSHAGRVETSITEGAGDVIVPSGGKSKCDMQKRTVVFYLLHPPSQTLQHRLAASAAISSECFFPLRKKPSGPRHPAARQRHHKGMATSSRTIVIPQQLHAAGYALAVTGNDAIARHNNDEAEAEDFRRFCRYSP